MAKKNTKPAVEWFIGKREKGKRGRPFAYSTKAESDGIREMLSLYGDLRLIPKDTLFNKNQWSIIDKFIENGEYKPNVR